MKTCELKDVQDILNGRKRIPAAKLLSLEKLPLRNYLKCNKCHRMLTGSSSKGKSKHYYFYHCDLTCGVRYNAVETNKLFLKLLKSWVVNPAGVELLKMVISSVYKTRTQSDFNKKSQVLNDIAKQNEKIAKARGLLLDGELDSADYKEIKPIARL